MAFPPTYHISSNEANDAEPDERPSTLATLRGMIGAVVGKEQVIDGRQTVPIR